MSPSLSEIRDRLSTFAERFQPRHRVIASHLEQLSRGEARDCIAVLHDEMGERVVIIKDPYDNDHGGPQYAAYMEGTRRFVSLRVREAETDRFLSLLEPPHGDMPEGRAYHFSNRLIEDAHGMPADAGGFGDRLITVLDNHGVWNPAYQQSRHVSALFEQLGRYQNPYPSASKGDVLPYESPPGHAESGPLSVNIFRR